MKIMVFDPPLPSLTPSPSSSSSSSSSSPPTPQKTTAQLQAGKRAESNLIPLKHLVSPPGYYSNNRITKAVAVLDECGGHMMVLPGGGIWTWFVRRKVVKALPPLSHSSSSSSSRSPREREREREEEEEEEEEEDNPYYSRCTSESTT
ncbi:hypothetical protein M0804_014108 [Polistes exclamans]|nr:hypothetical protein M0804_014112 [Polistes exclamans]KAI4475753.1 hypothetical protein M0804_014108 [Polistes exclamans]